MALGNVFLSISSIVINVDCVRICNLISIKGASLKFSLYLKLTMLRGRLVSNFLCWNEGKIGNSELGQSSHLCCLYGEWERRSILKLRLLTCEKA